MKNNVSYNIKSVFLRKTFTLISGLLLGSLFGFPTFGAADLAKGKELFLKNCQVCHGADATGNTDTGKALKARNLVLEPLVKAKGKDDEEKIFDAMTNGIPQTAMASMKAAVPEEKDRKAIAAYVNSLRKPLKK